MTRIIIGDAIRTMRAMPPESVDLVVTDPPYPVISGGNTGKRDGVDRPSGMLAANDGKIFKYNDLLPDQYMPEIYRVLRPVAHFYVMTNELNRRVIEDAAHRAGFQTHALLVWEKQNVTPSRWYMKNGEFTLFLRKGAARAINNPGSKAVHRAHNPVGNKLHPTEKPVDLMRLYIENSSLPGQIVLDPFAGAGSTLVAARDTMRRGIGIEIDQEYAMVACRRLRVLPESRF